jgi:dinuclear metal center YbgI/SA1388 family protein
MEDWNSFLLYGGFVKLTNRNNCKGGLMNRVELLNYLDKTLNAAAFSDYAPNGLQVEGKAEINSIVTAVSASVELFEKAIERKADAVIVHHGIIWNYERPIYQGSYKQRVKKLLEHDLNLFAYHLPLDAHPELGNAAQIAKVLNLTNLEPFGEHNSNLIGVRGRVMAVDIDQFIKTVKDTINPEAIFFPFGPEKLHSVGIISGGGQKEFRQAVENRLDLYLTGEASEYILHFAKEEHIHYIAAGHYATERFGTIALGNHIKKRFGVAVEFVDIPNPI